MFVSFIYFRNGSEPYVISRNMNECDYLSGLSIKWDHQNTHVANVYFFFLFSAIGYVDRVSNVIFCVVMLIFWVVIKHRFFGEEKRRLYNAVLSVVSGVRFELARLSSSTCYRQVTDRYLRIPCLQFSVFYRPHRETRRFPARRHI